MFLVTLRCNLIKGAKTFVDYSENLYLHYFEKQPSIVFNEIIIHILKLCLFTHEIEISWIWNHFYYIKLIFFPTQNNCWHNFFNDLKFEHVLSYLNLHQMLSNLLWVLTYFIKKVTCRNPTLRQMWGWDSHSQKWELGVLRDSCNFRAQLQRSKHLALKCSLNRWKGLEV